MSDIKRIFNFETNYNFDDLVDDFLESVILKSFVMIEKRTRKGATFPSQIKIKDGEPFDFSHNLRQHDFTLDFAELQKEKDLLAHNVDLPKTDIDTALDYYSQFKNIKF